MSTVRRFEDLECWQETRGLVRVVYDLTKREAFRKDFGLVDQVRRSAVSSMANIQKIKSRHTANAVLKQAGPSQIVLTRNPKGMNPA